MTDKFLIKRIKSGHWKYPDKNPFPNMIQWFLLLDDDIKQNIIDVYNDKDLGLDFWEYLGVTYHGWGHPLDWR